MRFEFSATVDEVNCHIRSFDSDIILGETVDQQPHKHYLMEFHCIFAGEETVYLPMQDREIRLTPGQILMLPAGIYHSATTQNGNVERICFNFSVDSSQKDGSPILEMYQNVREVSVFEDSDANEFLRQCRRLRLQESGRLTGVQQGLLLLSAVLRLLDRVNRSQEQPLSESAHALHQKWIIEEYIELHFADNMGLDGLAQALFLSQRQTRKLVRRFMGEDYKTLVIRRRMELAEIYLRDPNKTLEEIAWQVGYRSYSGFQLCFRKYFGCSPSEKRNG